MRKYRVCWKARSALEVGERDNTTPSELKAETGRRVAEHSMAASQVIALWLLGDSPARETSWVMGVVKLQLEVGGTSTVWQSRKLNLKNFSQGLSAKILVLENF